MKAIDPAKSSNYLTKAENSLRIAKIALEQEAYDNAIMSSIHSAINSLDALTTSCLGKRASGSHNDVVTLIKGIFSEKERLDISRQFTTLLSLKNTSEYQPDLMKKSDAESSIVNAERIFTKVKAKLQEKK